MDNSALTYLEWDILRENVKLSKIDERTELPKGQKTIEVNRDDDYNLRAVLYFKDPTFIRSQAVDVAGSFSENFEIHGSYLDSVSCTLESCVIGTIKTHPIRESEETLDSASLHFSGLRMKYKNENEGVHLKEWYINGPRDHVFSRFTERKLVRHFTRERFANKESRINSVEISLEGNSISTDFVHIKIDEYGFLITKIPEGIGPMWSSNIGIEYRKAWGQIPDTHEREKIEELCSFIFGRQLLSVGYTIYDQKENIVEVHAHGPWGKEARSHCSEPDKPPVRISDGAGGRAEVLICQLLPKYCDMRERFRLKEALWNYWISRNVPIGTNLSMLASALESVINGWFNYNESPSKGVYMEKEGFESLVKDEIEQMRRKLRENMKTEDSTENSKADKIMDNILRSYQFGIMERYRIFFKEIGLVISDIEWEAIKERHKFVHGRIMFDTADWKQVIQHVNTFETLLHKVILKLLGYAGVFVDRSILGWNDKQLS